MGSESEDQESEAPRRTDCADLAMSEPKIAEAFFGELRESIECGIDKGSGKFLDTDFKEEIGSNGVGIGGRIVNVHRVSGVSRHGRSGTLLERGCGWLGVKHLFCNLGSQGVSGCFSGASAAISVRRTEIGCFVMTRLSNDHTHRSASKHWGRSFIRSFENRKKLRSFPYKNPG